MNNFSKNTLNIVDSIVNIYVEYDRYDRKYYLDYHKISNILLEELAASIMADDTGRASEATGPDNPAFEKYMLPSLINFMKNSSDKDEAIEFMNSWKCGITSYFDSIMQELINDRLVDHNFYHQGDAA